MSKYINELEKLYKDEKDNERPPNYIKSVKKLLKFYGVKAK